MSNTTRDIAPTPDFSLISTWSNTDYDMLTIDLVSYMSKDKIQQMLHPELIPISAISGLTEQIPALVNNISLFASDWFNSLEISTIQAIPATQLNQINLAILF